MQSCLWYNRQKILRRIYLKKVLLRLLLLSIICIIVFFIERYSHKYIETSTDTLTNDFVNSSNFANSIDTYIDNEPKKIISRGELKTSGLFKLKDGTMDSSIDLMVTDMNESDFEKSFLVIVADENLKHFDYEKDLIIYDVYSDGSVTHIIMKQRENPNLEVNQVFLNNVFYAIVDNSQLNESSDIVIEQ